MKFHENRLLADYILYFFQKLGKMSQNLSSATVVLFVCFVALRPKATAMVMAGRSVHITTLFPGQA